MRPRILRLGVALAASMVLVTSAAAQRAKPKDVDLSGVARHREWTLVNKKPHFVYSASALLCSAPVKPLKDPSPHADKYIRVFVNPVGRSAMMKDGRSVYPAGSVIVKEKLPSAEAKSPELLTVMVKREKGFNAKQGDWEYAVFDGTGSKLQARGRLANCQSCHAKKSKEDYVFRTYRTEEDRKAYRLLTTGPGSVARR